MRYFLVAITLFYQCSLVFAVESNSFSEYDGKKVRIIAPCLEMNTYGWQYYIDNEWLQAIKEEVFSDMNLTEAEFAYTMNTVDFAFFLFEPADRMIHAFRTNMNLIIDAGLKKDLSLADYARIEAKDIELLLKNVRMIEINPLSLQGTEFYSIEYEFDSPSPQSKGAYLRCHAIAYLIIAEGKAYLFTAVATARDFKLKKPAILATLGSLRKYTR